MTIANSISTASKFQLGWRINWLAYCIVLPAILIRCAFTVVPMVQTFLLSLTNQNLTNEGRFIGPTNYIRLVQDSTFLNNLGSTLLYAALRCSTQLLASSWSSSSAFWSQ